MVWRAGAWSHEIDVAAIERELMRLLRSPENVSQTGAPGTRSAVVSAVVNLVAYAADQTMVSRIVGTLAALVGHHPSRTIVALPSAATDGGPDIDARVSVQCHALGTTGLHVCSEHIVLEAKQRALRRVPNVVLPLLLSDLLVVLWWPGEPLLRDPLLFDLLGPANRFVVDSTGFVHVERSLVMLDALRSRPGVMIDLADLNWGRLLPWRELVAQFWDMAAFRTHLSRLDRIEIDLGKPAGGRSNRPQALLLAGWLASRLGWTPLAMARQRDGYRLRAKRRGGEVEFVIKIRPEETSGIRAVRFVRETGRTARFELAVAQGESATATVQIGSGDPIVRMVRLEHLTEGELLAAELDLTTADFVFESSLAVAAAFLKAS
jgi:glucose-6-phosphate dehydrogenase assembly protein OpcA